MEDMKTIKALLSKAEQQLTNQRQHQQKTGEDFNIFTVLDRERKEESTHCRLLYELLNPKGSHRCDDAFLRKFFEVVLGKPYEEAIGVYREENTGDGRIDLVIEGQNYYYPIEVKIDAGDQDRQIERYITFASRKNRKETEIYYLTLDGHKPSPKSLGGFPEKQVKCISFPKQIKDWLVRCVEIVKDKPNIKVILEQYIQLIDRLEGTLMTDSLVKMISSSKNSYESAIEIAKKLPFVQAEKMRAVFRKIEEIVGDRFEKIVMECSFQDALNYYTSAKWPDPSLVYLIKSAGEQSVELWFQVDHYNDLLWYGVVLRKGESVPKEERDVLAFSDMFDNEIWKKRIETISAEKYNWWVWSKELPSNDHPLHFRADDEDYCGLFDESTFTDKIEEIRAEIDREIEHIQKKGLPIKNIEK